VLACSIKKKFIGNQTVSRGIAQVTYATKQQAAEAMKNLYYDNLGEDI